MQPRFGSNGKTLSSWLGSNFSSQTRAETLGSGERWRVDSKDSAGGVPFTQRLPLSGDFACAVLMMSRSRSLGCRKEYSAFGEDHHHHQDHHSLWIRIRLPGMKRSYRLCWITLSPSPLRYWCYRVASKKIFDYIMGVIILANAVSVGLEVQYSQGSQAFWSLQGEPKYSKLEAARLQSGEDTGWMYWPPGSASCISEPYWPHSSIHSRC